MNNFEDWKEEYGLQYEPNYSEHTEKDCKNAFEAGAQSKQVRIDELQNKLDYHIETNADLSRLVLELQGRIDEALHTADESCGVGVAAFVKLNRILKCNQSDFFENAEQPPKYDIKW